MISAVQEAACTVVISRGQSRNPQKRGLEQGIAEEIANIEGINVLTIPHLYDLPKNSDAYQKLTQIDGDFVVVSWIFARAAHWILDRNGIQGQVGEVKLGEPDEEDEDTEEDEPPPPPNPAPMDHRFAPITSRRCPPRKCAET